MTKPVETAPERIWMWREEVIQREGYFTAHGCPASDYVEYVRADLTRTGSPSAVWDEAIEIARARDKFWEDDRSSQRSERGKLKSKWRAMGANSVILALEAAKSASLATREPVAEKWPGCTCNHICPPQSEREIDDEVVCVHADDCELMQATPPPTTTEAQVVARDTLFDELSELTNASYGELRSSVEINRQYHPCAHENVIDGAKFHYKNYATPEEWQVAERVSGWFQERITAIASKHLPAAGEVEAERLDAAMGYVPPEFRKAREPVAERAAADMKAAMIAKVQELFNSGLDLTDADLLAALEKVGPQENQEDGDG